MFVRCAWCVQEKFTLESTTHRVMSASGLGAGKQQTPGPQRSAAGKATGGGARSKEEEQLLKEERIEAEKAKRKALRDKVRSSQGRARQGSVPARAREAN